LSLSSQKYGFGIRDPGSGKTYSGSGLRGQKGTGSRIRIRNTGFFPQENDCLGEWDEAYECHELEEERLLDLLEVRQVGGGLILEHHVTDIFPERWFDLVLVLRTDNTRLYDRSEFLGRGILSKVFVKKTEIFVFCMIF
jgi:adenylate kinase